MKNKNVPSHTVEALERYWNHGFEPGSFLMSLLMGDLYAAVARADHWNKGNFAAIVDYVVMEGPEGSWGSEYAVRNWIAKGDAFQNYQRRRVVNILSNDYEEKNYDF